MHIFLTNPDEFWARMEQILKMQQSSKTVQASIKWIRSSDVRELLNISDSTLQTMRINGTIPAYKLGPTWFYKEEEINAVLEAGKSKGGNHAK